MNTEHQPWAIHLKAKAKNFHLKFKATTFLPASYTFFQFTIFLKISSLIIQVSSDNNQTVRRKSLKSKIIGFIQKFRSKTAKRNTFPDQNFWRFKRMKWAFCKGPIFASSVVIGNLALLIKSICEEDVKGITVHCLSILLFYILTLLKTFIRTKYSKFLLVSVLAMVGYGYPLWLNIKSNPSYERRTFGWRYIGKTTY